MSNFTIKDKYGNTLYEIIEEIEDNDEKESKNNDKYLIKTIPIENLTIIKTIGDGNCFFHCILQATSIEYSDSDRNHKVNLVKELRDALADILQEEYPNLSRGELKELSKSVPEYSLNHMTNELRSSKHVNHLYNELIGNHLGIDIYIIDAEKSDVYITCDEDYLLKNRPSLVLYWTGNHYDLISHKEADLFQWDHEFIIAIRKRIREIKEKKKLKK